MKFSSSSKKLMTRGELSVVNLRRTLLGSVCAVCAVAVLAFGAGLLVGLTGQDQSIPVKSTQAESDPAKANFSIEKLGELSGRLVRLETDAAYLVKTVGNHEEIARKLALLNPELVPTDEAPMAEVDNAGKGGLLLPPRTCDQNEPGHLQGKSRTHNHLDQLEASINCLRLFFDQVEQAVAARSADFMSIPSLRPIEDAKIGSAFGNRVDPFTRRLAFHSGLDFAARSGTPIYAAAGGRVKTAGPHSSYGNMVEIDHGNGLLTRYAHAGKVYVNVGDVVTPQQRIAAVGSTGRSTGPHLHFEIMYHGQFVNPQHFLSLNNMEFATDDTAAD